MSLETFDFIIIITIVVVDDNRSFIIRSHRFREKNTESQTSPVVKKKHNIHDFNECCFILYSLFCSRYLPVSFHTKMPVIVVAMQAFRLLAGSLCCLQHINKQSRSRSSFPSLL